MKNNIIHYRIVEDVHYNEHSEKEKVRNPYSIQIEQKGLFGKKWKYVKYKHTDYAFEGWYMEILTFRTVDEAHDYIKRMMDKTIQVPGKSPFQVSLFMIPKITR